MELQKIAQALEEQIIGCVVQGAPLHELIGLIDERHFTSEQTGAVWKAIQDLNQKGKAASVRNLRGMLKGHQSFRDDGEVDYFTHGDQDLGIPAFAKDIALRLINNHARISLQYLASNVLEEVKFSEAESPVEKIIHTFRDGLENLKTESGFKQTSNVSVADLMLQDIASPPPITKTGIPSYDRILGGGFMAGEVYTVAGASKSGKTMIAGTISYNFNQQGVRHAYLCLEMGSKQIMQRQFAIYANVPVSTFLNEASRTSTRLSDKLIEFQGDLMSKENQEFIDCPMLRMSDAKALLYRLKMEGCAGVIIDYFSLISPDAGFKGTNNEHQDIMAQELTKTAKDLGLWLLIVAQMNNDGKTYGSSALLRASTHSAALERCDTEHNDQGYRWLRTMFSRFTPAEDIGSETEAGLRIHRNGSHIEDLIYG